ncbi:hypothetical protein J3R83DRAFT_6024 [Lanmaoa asiatica]|nr:hypothetical protein J3R83DRAFT_6024 [Lanmaoa asiatica]
MARLSDRCEEVDVRPMPNALNILTSTTLQYALKLISCAQVITQKRKAEKVDVEDLRRAQTYLALYLYT